VTRMSLITTDRGKVRGGGAEELPPGRDGDDPRQGSRRRNWDRTGPRPLETTIWYPSAPTGKAVVPADSPFDRCRPFITLDSIP